MRKKTQPMSPAELKTLRASLGWSQRRLADEIGVDRNTVNRWEMGRHPIAPLTAHLLAHLASGKIKISVTTEAPLP